MQDKIIDLFADSANSLEDKVKGKSQKAKGKGQKVKDNGNLKSSMMMEAMGLLSNPKKLKKIIAIVVILLLIGVGSTVAFFIIYPIAILWAIISFSAINLLGMIINFIKNVYSERDR